MEGFRPLYEYDEWKDFCLCTGMVSGRMVFNSDRMENSLETNQSPRKLDFTDFFHGNSFREGLEFFIYFPVWI